MRSSLIKKLILVKQNQATVNPRKRRQDDETERPRKQIRNDESDEEASHIIRTRQATFVEVQRNQQALRSQARFELKISCFNDESSEHEWQQVTVLGERFRAMIEHEFFAMLRQQATYYERFQALLRASHKTEHVGACINCHIVHVSKKTRPEGMACRACIKRKSICAAIVEQEDSDILIIGIYQLPVKLRAGSDITELSYWKIVDG